MAGFLVEFRLRGHGKKYAKWARARTLREAKRLGVRRLKESRFVPHITLFGSAETNNLRRVVRDVASIGRKYTLVPFKLGIKRGEFQNQDANWLYLDLEPSEPLEQLRHEMAQRLLGSEGKISHTCKSYDRNQQYRFHCSIGRYDPRDKAKLDRLFDYAETKCTVEAFRQSQDPFFRRLLNVVRRYVFGTHAEDNLAINQHLLRVTILGRGRIQAEYDLVLKRILSRREALSRYWWRRTIEKLRDLKTEPLNQESEPLPDKPVYLIGDTHFDHTNIIRYCGRPFSEVNEMNQVIKNKWNSTVGDSDTVYFLGDWTFGRRHRPARYWKDQLNGNIVSILGGHDRGQSGMRYYDFRELRVGKYDFLLIHNPDPCGKHQTQEQAHKLENWHGWIIHGHVHNNELDRYPFINGDNKTINVSAEVVGYRPVSLSHLLSLNLDSIKRMRTIGSEPERW